MTRAAARVCGLLLVLLAAPVPGAAFSCRDDVIDIRGPEGASRFTVEIADEPEERRKGLMFREEMAAGHGMLFIFETSGPRAFWMKNTPLPLDLIFLDEEGRVVSVQADAEPFSERSLPSEGDALGVLEINGGLAARYGIGPGAVARHPMFDAGAAAWPCE